MVDGEATLEGKRKGASGQTKLAMRRNPRVMRKIYETAYVFTLRVPRMKKQRQKIGSETILWLHEQDTITYISRDLLGLGESHATVRRDLGKF